jgi:hypothetical protein
MLLRPRVRTGLPGAPWLGHTGVDCSSLSAGRSLLPACDVLAGGPRPS